MENIWMFLQQTAAASLVALFLLILQRIFLDKLSPRWQYGVWLVLLLRLLVPAGFGGRPTVLDVTFWVETLRTRVELGLHSAYSTPFAASLPAAPVPLPPAGAPASWTDWAFLIYCAGAVLWAAWFVVSAVRLSLRVRGGVPVEGERRAAMEALAKQQRLPMPRRIVECRWARTPFVVGVVRPALVLPMGWALDEKVVLHELLHLKYRDVWAGWLTTALRCLHWCNPFLWFVFDKTGNDRESLCDQRVLERLEGEDRRDYGRCLLAMADDKAVRTPGATTMANGARAVKARIEAIARFKRFPQGMGLVSGCIVFALSLSLVAGVPVCVGGGRRDHCASFTGDRNSTGAGGRDPGPGLPEPGHNRGRGPGCLRQGGVPPVLRRDLRRAAVLDHLCPPGGPARRFGALGAGSWEGGIRLAHRPGVPWVDLRRRGRLSVSGVLVPGYEV